MSQVALPAEGGERHQEYICGTRTSLHSAVGAYSTVCAKGPTHTPTKLGQAKYCRPSQPPGEIDILRHRHPQVSSLSTVWETFSLEDCPSHKSSIFAFVTNLKK
ncbi:uncharacterized protein LOC144067816 [Stigmatopora argus]